MHNLMLAISLFSYICSPVATMREQPDPKSEIISQAYFSERVTPLEEDHDWIKIEVATDHYQGWIQKNALCQREDLLCSSPTSRLTRVNRRAAHVYDVEDTIYGPILTLPYESKLEALEANPDSDSRWIKVLLVDGRQGYIQRGDITFDHSIITRDQMCDLSLQFLGLPYTWGGRASFGYDCSGFVQMLYRQMGISIPRDSKNQMQFEGFASVSFEDLTPGDLIFFGPSEDQIRHVGMYLGNDRFIHATVAENAPYIHISKLSDKEWNGSTRLGYRAAKTLK